MYTGRLYLQEALAFLLKKHSKFWCLTTARVRWKAFMDHGSLAGDLGFKSTVVVSSGGRLAPLT